MKNKEEKLVICMILVLGMLVVRSAFIDINYRLNKMTDNLYGPYK